MSKEEENKLRKLIVNILNNPVNIMQECILCHENIKNIRIIREELSPPIIEYECPKCCVVRINPHGIIYPKNERPYLSYIIADDRSYLQAYFRHCNKKNIQPKVLSESTINEIIGDLFDMRKGIKIRNFEEFKKLIDESRPITIRCKKSKKSEFTVIYMDGKYSVINTLDMSKKELNEEELKKEFDDNNWKDYECKRDECKSG